MVALVHHFTHLLEKSINVLMAVEDVAFLTNLMQLLHNSVMQHKPEPFHMQTTKQYLSIEILVYGVKRLSCGCITHPDLDDVDSDREPTVYFGNKAYNVGKPLETT